ncbi:hypothetical protein, partial [Candidatus Enterovibrio escicola]|uniref:hypothetical protein n=1 Tax=Candidatus Enterovibrio escicola TaxID=1927127 RepID=UPI001CC30A7C
LLNTGEITIFNHNIHLIVSRESSHEFPIEITTSSKNKDLDYICVFCPQAIDKCPTLENPIELNTQ